MIGIIYMLFSNNTQNYYIGSTFQSIDKRLIQHKSRAVLKTGGRASIIINAGDYEIYEIENINVNSKEDLRIIEDIYIKSHKEDVLCINNNRAFSDKDSIRDIRKKYYEKNKEARKDFSIKYYNDHRQELLEKKKYKYQQDKKNKILKFEN